MQSALPPFRDQPVPFARRALVGYLVVALVALQCPLPLRAGPVGEQVVQGTADFNRTGPITTITVSNSAIINYTGFNIAGNESVIFNQPSVASRVLNRVNSEDPTQILGTLKANGVVYLVNPAGIYFGNTSFIDVGGLYAASGSISNQDFLANVNRFSGLNGTTANSGAIESGSVAALIGRTVQNSGSIVSQNGPVALVAGNEVFLGEAGQRVFVNLGTLPRDGVGIENSGKAEAQGADGRVTLAVGDLYSLAIRQSGILTGPNVTVDAGAGKVEVSGSMQASNPAGIGGAISVLGQEVLLAPTARLDATGSTGGGTILVGGDLQGKNVAVPNAQTTTVAAGAQLRADASGTGDGGKVIVWADNRTQFAGDISARGGVAGGNGGFAEVSGKGYLEYQGLADLRAPLGSTGTLLLDPTDITISGAGSDTAPTFGSFTGGTFAGGANDTSTISIGTGVGDVESTLLKQLASANVVITTSSTGAGTGNITVSGVINYTSGNSLTLNADNNLIINNAINNAGAGNLILNGAGIALNASVQASAITLNHSGALTGTGRVAATTLSLTGTGNVGSAGTPLTTDVGTLALSKSAGAVFVSDLGSLTVQGTASGSLSVDSVGALTVNAMNVGNAATGALSARANTGITVGGAVVAVGATFNADKTAASRASTAAI